MSIFEYDEEAHMRLIREEGRDKGIEEAMILIDHLLSENRLTDLKRVTRDEKYMKSLIEEFETVEDI